MGRFSNLRGAAVVSDAVRSYTFHDLAGSPELQVAPATQANREYFNAALAAARDKANVGRKVTVASLADDRITRAKLYARHVVKGWSGVKDATGALVPFSPEACEEFLEELAGSDLSYLFIEFVNFIEEERNFTAEAIALGKSSSSG